MKASPHFKTAIQNYLNSLAAKDELFAETLKKPKKNIDECITYIFNQVQKSGYNGFEDDEIFGMAIHYYDEDNIEIGKAFEGTVVVNHSATNKPKEKIEKVEKPKEPTKKTNQPKVGRMDVAKQVSLFDFDGVKFSIQNNNGSYSLLYGFDTVEKLLKKVGEINLTESATKKIRL